MKIHLSRQLVLEERINTADGKGGYSVGWSALGTLWADVDARSGREVLVGKRDHTRGRFRIIVRGVPVGAASRPKPDQRFREGEKTYAILAVATFDPHARYLECWAEEGKE